MVIPASARINCAAASSPKSSPSPTAIRCRALRHGNECVSRYFKHGGEMKLKSIAIRDFKRFSDLTVTNLPETAKMVLLTGPNGSGKTSLFEAFNFWNNYVKSNIGYEAEYYERGDFRTKDWPEMLQRIKPEFYGEGHDVEQQDPSRKEFYIRSAYRHEADFTSEGIQNTEDILHDTH